MKPKRRVVKHSDMSMTWEDMNRSFTMQKRSRTLHKVWKDAKGCPWFNVLAPCSFDNALDMLDFKRVVF